MNKLKTILAAGALLCASATAFPGNNNGFFANTVQQLATDVDHILYQQVADKLGVTVGTVHQRVNSGQYQVLTISSDTSIKRVMMDENNNLLGEVVIG